MLKKSRESIWFVMAAVFLLIAACLGFLLFELNRNEKQVEAVYEESRKVVLEERAEELKELIEEDSTQEQLIAYMEETLPYEGSSWSYLQKNSNLVFLKDADTTQQQNQDTVQVFSDYENQGMKSVAVSFSAEEDEYTVGIFYRQSVMDNLSKGYMHRMYVLVDMAILAAVCYVLIAWQAVKLKNQKRLIEHQQSAMNAQNQKLEYYSEQLTMQKQPDNRETGNGYDRELLEKILEKTTDGRLFPFGMFYLRIRMGNRYFSRRQMEQFTENIKEKMGKNMLFLEVAKGEFVLLLHKTGKDAFGEMERFLKEEWQESMKAQNVECDIAQIFNETGKTSVLEQYNSICKKTEEQEGV